MDIARRNGYEEIKIKSLIISSKALAYRLQNFKVIFDYQNLCNLQDPRHSDFSTNISGRKFILHSVCTSVRCNGLPVFCSYIESKEIKSPLAKRIDFNK